jgi:peptidoglycan/LPS O-acetylase OafA/YrhL
VVVVGIALWWLIGDYQGSTMSALGAAAVALTYTGNIARSFLGESQGVFSPMWSLSMEEQFYLVWPPLLMLLIAVVATRRVMVAVLGALVVASVVASGFLFDVPSGGSTPDIYFSPVLNVAPLLLGCALALVMGSEKGRAAFQGRLGAVATWVGLGGVVGSLALIDSGWQQTVTTFTVMLPGVAVAAALLIGGLVSRPSLPARVLSLGPVAWFGRALSYPIYLWHVVFIALVTPIVPGALGVLAVIAASIVTAYLSYRFVEGPALRLKDRLGSSSKEARSTSPADRELTSA